MRFLLIALLFAISQIGAFDNASEAEVRIATNFLNSVNATCFGKPYKCLEPFIHQELILWVNGKTRQSREWLLSYGPKTYAGYKIKEISRDSEKSLKVTFKTKDYAVMDILVENDKCLINFMQFQSEADL